MEPELFDGEEAAALIKELQLILEVQTKRTSIIFFMLYWFPLLKTQKLDTCSCRMEQGAFRVDANISVNRPGDEFGVRTEVKNLNSVRSVCNAIEYEIGRQIGVLETGGVVENETMSFDAVTKETLTMRDKEKKQDYR